MNRIHREELYTKIIIQISMHPDIEKLINLAKETGVLTDKQREIILRKAEKLGEDVDEIEMILESIPMQSSRKENSTSKAKKRKCPHCGATIPVISLKCPECGYLLEDESNAAKESREHIEALQKKLARYGNELEDEEKKARIIQGATMPRTVEGLSQMLSFAYSNYLSTGRDGDGRPLVKNAWLGKAKEVYIQLQMRAKEDETVQGLLNQYSFILMEKPAKSYSALIAVGSILLGLVVIFLCLYFGGVI